MDFLIHYFPYVIAGTLYGFIFGLVPIAGASTGLLTVYSFLYLFRYDPYSLVVFTTALVVSCSVGDLFSSIVMNIPGGNGSAATMVDGFPMTQQGQSARALSAAVFSSCGQGLLWGVLVFAFLPYYTEIVLHFGIPEMLMFMLLALTSVSFINSNYWMRGILGACVGIFLGLVGSDPITTAERFTGGWFYLANGIQVITLMSGVLAMPEILQALFLRVAHVPPPRNPLAQIVQGARDAWQYRWDSIRGGLIGGIIGLLPGVGGAIVDWLAYGQTVAGAKDRDIIPFGQGNVRGVVGAEGSGMAQKATAYVPTVLFGVPGAPFEVVVMALYMYVGLEMGSPQLLTDNTFFHALSYGFGISLLLTFALSIWFIKYANSFTSIPFKYYFVPLLGIITWSCAQYTGGWEDYAMLAACGLLGMLLKFAKISRACVVIGFILSARIESTGIQFLTLYKFTDLLNRPISLVLMLAIVIAVIFGVFFNKTKISYV
jgi:TctA family transporter